MPDFVGGATYVSEGAKLVQDGTGTGLHSAMVRATGRAVHVFSRSTKLFTPAILRRGLGGVGDIMPLITAYVLKVIRNQELDVFSPHRPQKGKQSRRRAPQGKWGTKEAGVHMDLNGPRYPGKKREGIICIDIIRDPDLRGIIRYK
ncbi:hypothetical protein DL95DRAFT_418868 [Leptodontidium sp. 2 PMI_412]|nr:hypothetical protein DL95DRAFT_418868 [Leptodontidium sp. 2 PMI_412]